MRKGWGGEGREGGSGYFQNGVQGMTSLQSAVTSCTGPIPELTIIQIVDF